MTTNLYRQVEPSGVPTVKRNSAFTPEYFQSGFIKNDPYSLMGRVNAVDGLHMPLHHQRSETLPYNQPQHTQPRSKKSMSMEYDGLPSLIPPVSPMIPKTNTELESELATYNDGVRISDFNNILARERAEIARNKQEQEELRKRRIDLDLFADGKLHPIPELPQPPTERELLQELVSLMKGQTSNEVREELGDITLEEKTALTRLELNTRALIDLSLGQVIETLDVLEKSESFFTQDQQKRILILLLLQDTLAKGDTPRASELNQRVASFSTPDIGELSFDEVLSLYTEQV